ncbi:MAG: rRNA pseudouridine synthase [Ardenticatenaceae bacterium]|nr:rRNA pseudouridine synthase [Anaerolineales bacterium]MCB8920371.1 rRNA pseudouridine synthase [Ardenticatenaceae bacterium]MCB8989326.1 rRNA pseudouridine synthase [Ardenticatenaceae bacterium]
MNERLQKLMAQAGLASRRECETWIAAGRVKVNGRTAKLGDKANPLTDEILLDGKPLDLSRDRIVYIALHKPKGVISSTEDEMRQGRTTVRDLVDVPGHLYPVGRLDKPSEGLILLTNDGDLAHKLTHPRYEHEKTYEALVAGDISNAALEEWRWGVMLDEDVTAPAEITVLERHGDYTRLEIVLREGRKRQIRRIAADLGHPVLRLVRLKIGTLELGNLEPGKWRFLRPREVAALRRLINR